MDFEAILAFAEGVIEANMEVFNDTFAFVTSQASPALPEPEISDNDDDFIYDTAEQKSDSEALNSLLESLGLAELPDLDDSDTSDVDDSDSSDLDSPENLSKVASSVSQTETILDTLDNASDIDDLIAEQHDDMQAGEDQGAISAKVAAQAEQEVAEYAAIRESDLSTKGSRKRKHNS